MNPELTDRQKEILGVIAACIREKGRPPSIRELMDEMGIASPNGIAKHLKALAQKGFIELMGGARGIRLLADDGDISYTNSVEERNYSPDVAFVPLVGRIAAGAPILSQEHLEGMLPVPKDMVSGLGETMFLEVKGNSMTDVGIMPGDLVLLEKRDTVANGELAGVMIEDEATVKRFYKQGSILRLEPANPDYEPIVIDLADGAQCQVVGRVVGLLRSYRRTR
jgi:repressor LexA